MKSRYQPHVSEDKREQTNKCVEACLSMHDIYLVLKYHLAERKEISDKGFPLGGDFHQTNTCLLIRTEILAFLPIETDDFEGRAILPRANISHERLCSTPIQGSEEKSDPHYY